MDSETKVRGRCTYSLFSVLKNTCCKFSRVHNTCLKRSLHFCWEYVLFDMSGFAVIVYNASLINLTTKNFFNVSAFC